MTPIAIPCPPEVKRGACSAHNCSYRRHFHHTRSGTTGQARGRDANRLNKSTDQYLGINLSNHVHRFLPERCHPRGEVYGNDGTSCWDQQSANDPAEISNLLLEG